jgi:hypothetical protein
MDQDPGTQVPVQGGDDQVPTDPTLGNTPSETPDEVVGSTAGDGDVTGNVEAPDEDVNKEDGVA